MDWMNHKVLRFANGCKIIARRWAVQIWGSHPPMRRLRNKTRNSVVTIVVITAVHQLFMPLATQERPHGLNNIRSRLYISHFLSTWNARVFEFGAVLYLAAIFPETLLPMSVYALVRGLSAIVFSSSIGAYIDNSERLHVVRTSIVVQRIAVALSCALFWVLSRFKAANTYTQIIALALLAVLACFEKVFAVVNLICVEKDWVVVIAEDDEDALRVMNSQMRRIDLTCKLGGPLVIALLSGFSNEVAILSNLGLNCLSVAYEYIAIAQVFNAVPLLQAPKTAPVSDADDGNVTTQQFNKWLPSRQCMTSWSIDALSYCRHKVFLPSFAGAVLYLTVLTFGGQMVTYLLAAGYGAIHIGLVRTISVAVELSATWAAPIVMAKIGAVRAGIWFLNWQLLCLISACLAFFSLHSPVLAATGLVIGTIMSRVGLWGYDLSAQVLVQNEIEAQKRGAFASQEAQWQNAFEILSFTITIIFSRPDQFRWPVLISCCATGVAAALYAYFVRTRRGHLLHLSHCMSKEVESDAEAEGLMMNDRA